MKKIHNESGVYFYEMILPKEIKKLLNNNYIKIGQAVNLNERIRDLKTAIPFNYKIIGFIPIERNKKLLNIEENRAKNWFANYHYNREWYLNAKYEIVNYVKTRNKDLTERETDKEVI
jgi:hypothetical protein